ncbi:MAG: hypothetical protein HUJ71_05685 [Pseudobutyrivibrio sp.]|nr:hypothetical protein [Pseudobutyrivibrio sp.]
MADKAKIPCRNCGKMFEPCDYCSKNSDVFRWRNFACSIECAKAYIAAVEAVRSKTAKSEPEPKPAEEPKKKNKKESFFSKVETAIVPAPIPSYEDINPVIDIDIEVESKDE